MQPRTKQEAIDYLVRQIASIELTRFNLQPLERDYQEHRLASLRFDLLAIRLGKKTWEKESLEKSLQTS